jgi:hypothetical protein
MAGLPPTEDENNHWIASSQAPRNDSMVLFSYNRTMAGLPPTEDENNPLAPPAWRGNKGWLKPM